MANRFGQMEAAVHDQIVFVDYESSVINLSNKKKIVRRRVMISRWHPRIKIKANKKRLLFSVLPQFLSKK